MVVPLLIAGAILLGVVGLRVVGRDLAPSPAEAAVAAAPAEAAVAASSAGPVPEPPAPAVPAADPTPTVTTPSISVAATAGTGRGARDWALVLAEVDRARQAAFAGPDPEALTAADAPGSPALARDEQAVADLAARGHRVDGLVVTVLSTEVVADRGDEVELAVRDRRSAYRLVDEVGDVVAERPPAGERSWRVTLQHTADGWRTAEVLPG